MMMARRVFPALLLAVTSALAQDASPTITSMCTTTTGYIGIATSVTNFDEFLASLSAVYQTSGFSFSGASIPVHTTVVNHPDTGELVTALGYYDSNALSSAGYSFVSGVTAITTPCSPTSVTLPPSPTGSSCSPHGDHWHCEPTAPPTGTSTVTGTCEPHGDHWHCPDGVAEPTTPPGAATTPSGAATTPPSSASASCEPHGDHWHCPSGVAEPSTPPPASGTGPSNSTLPTVPTAGARRAAAPALALAGVAAFGAMVY